jgi:hypothetical protein
MELKRRTGEQQVKPETAPLPLTVSQQPLYVPQDRTPIDNPLAYHYRVKLRPILKEVCSAQYLQELDESVADQAQSKDPAEKIRMITEFQQRLEADLHRVGQAIEQDQEKIDSQSSCCGPLGKKDRQELATFQARVTKDRKAVAKAMNLVVRLATVRNEEMRSAGIEFEEAQPDLDALRTQVGLLAPDPS